MNNYLQHRQALKLGIATNPIKEKKPLAQQSEKKKQQLKEEKPNRDLQLDWFKERVAESTGKCMECGGAIEKNIFSLAIMAVAHCLPKRKGQFPSVAMHKLNSLELCVTNGCHQNYDSGWEAASQMRVWKIALERIIKIYPSIAPAEKMHLPDIIRQEIEA